MKTEYGDIHNFIDGRTEAAADLGYCVSVNPATEEPLARAAIASVQGVDSAVRAARRAHEQGGWRAMSVDTRAAYLHAIADWIEDRSADLARIECQDSGMTLKMCGEGHLPRTVAHFRYFAEEAKRQVGENAPLGSHYITLVDRVPLGVVAILAPWNSPLAVASINLAAALALGNCCIVKPSEQTPVTTSILSQAAKAVDLPPGVLNIVYGPPDPTGNAIVEHPDIDGICFVGGTETGKQIIARSARHIKRVTLELGGKSPTIILADADIDAALDGALLSVFSSNGEVCTAGSRIIVEAPLYRQFLDAFARRTRAIRVGDPLCPDTEMGPLISAAHWQRVQQCIVKGQEEGARHVCGGERPAGCETGYFMRPAVFADVDNRMAIAREEIFGPVACVLKAASAEQAVQMANDTPYGLAATIWSGDSARAMALSRQLRAGCVAVNTPLIRDIRMPFGGMKQSGLGRIGGRWSLEQFSEARTLCLPLEPLALPRYGLATTNVSAA